MNDYIVSVVLGIVEGLTEFLPVSSTAHLRLTEALLHVDLTSPYWKMYTVVIQLGAILALVMLFTGRILEFFRTFPEGENGDRTIFTHPLSLTMVAFVCTAVPSLLMIKLIGKHLESIRVIALSLLIGGIVMWVVDAMSVRRDLKTKDVEQMSLFQAVWIGLWEVTSAVFPGVSRSMSTIAAGQAVGMTRTAALEFSFLLSIPVMVAATGYEFLRTLHPKHIPGEEAMVPLVMTPHNWIVLAIGFVVSFGVALGVVEWFLIWVRRHGFVIFAVYRIILGSLLLALGADLPPEGDKPMMLRKLAGLCVAGACLSSAAMASTSEQTGTLKDLQTVGSTTKEQKRQQYDLVISTPDNEYVCRSKLGEKVKPIEFVVGTPLQFKLKGQNGEAINPAGKRVKCGVVRVSATPPVQPY